MATDVTIRNLVYDLCIEAGIPSANIDVSDLANITDDVAGMHVSSVVNTRQVLENLMETYLFDAFEDGNVIRFVRRNTPNEVVIPSDDFILGDNATTYEKTRVQDEELPDRTKVSFLDKSREYNVGSVDGHTITGLSTNIKKFTSICVLNQGYAKGLADAITHQAWTGRDSVKIELALTYRDLKPGDIFSFGLPGSQPKTYKIAEISIGSRVSVDAVAVNTRVNNLVVHDDDDGYDTTPATFGSSRIIFAEIPLVSDSAPTGNWSPRILAQQSPWPGGVSVYEDDFLGGYNLNTIVPVPAIMGELTAALGAPTDTDTWDGANTVQLQLYNAGDSLAASSDLAVLNGANGLAVLTPSGEWEILQYVDVDITGADTYTLSRLLRGQLGTEHYIGDPTPSGSLVFVANPLIYSYLEGTNERLGIERDFRFGPSNQSNNEPTYTDITITPRGVALRPYSPVQLRQSQAGSGDINLSWFRRTRFDGDVWGDTEIPLNEESEWYEIDILDGPFGSGNVVRTATVNSSTSYSYTVADQTADFGSAQSSVNWVVYQISALYGRGTPGVGNA